MKTFSALFCLFFLSTHAGAEARMCGANLEAASTHSTHSLSTKINLALSQFEAGLIRLPPPVGQSLASKVATWYKLKEFRSGVKSLLREVVPLNDRAAVCDRFVDLAVRYRAMNNRPRVIALMAEDLCSPNLRDVLMRLSSNALETSVVQEEPRWIQSISKNSILSPSDWRELLLNNPRDRLPTLVAVVGADWSKLGFVAEDVEAIARVGLMQRLSVFNLKRMLRLQEDQLARLTSAMDPLQWLEYMQRLGYASANLNQELKSRIASFIKPAENTDRQGRSAALSLLLDERLDDPTLTLVFATLKKSWRKIYGPDASFELPPLDRTKLSARQLSRLQMLNTPKPDPYKKVRAAARKAMKPVEILLQSAEFQTTAEFKNAFDLSRRYATTANTTRDPEEQARAQTIAKIYAKILQKRFADFQALKPSASDVRWFTEASLGLPLPLQLPLPGKRAPRQ